MSEQNTIQALRVAGARVHQQGWTPATSGNLSARRDAHSMWVTASGVSIGALQVDDLLMAGLDGQPTQSERKASAESALHGLLYQKNPDVGAVLHVHGPNATIASLCFDDEVVIEGFELLKAFEGIQTHDVSISVPIIDNHQEMAVLCERVSAVLDSSKRQYGVLIRGHGLYAWGRSISDTLRHLEAFEFLFTCVLALNRRD